MVYHSFWYLIFSNQSSNNSSISILYLSNILIFRGSLPFSRLYLLIQYYLTIRKWCMEIKGSKLHPFWQHQIGQQLRLWLPLEDGCKVEEDLRWVVLISNPEAWENGAVCVLLCSEAVLVVFFDVAGVDSWFVYDSTKAIGNWSSIFLSKLSFNQSICSNINFPSKSNWILSLVQIILDNRITLLKLVHPLVKILTDIKPLFTLPYLLDLLT